MRKARAAATPTASKPKPRARAKAKPKAKPSPATSLSGASSPSDSGSSPVAAGRRSFLAPSSPVTPKTRSPLAASSPFAAPTPATVGDLRSLAASHIDSLKRRLDALHGDSARDLEASRSRISKRFKMQTQNCMQLAEEAEKEHKKMVGRITDRAEEMKASYKKFVADVQSSTSRVCKVTVPEMAKSVERAIDGLRTRYNIPAASA